MSSLISYLGWSFLPNFVTSNVQSFYYNLTIRVGEAKPQPGSPTYNKHRKRIHAAVIIVYLLYTLYEADWEVQRAGDFYADLGVPHNVEEKALQTRFRRLTLLHHPDKINDPSRREAAESYYVHLKVARDTLLDPAKRFAYDRFGPQINEWRQCSTIQDFVLAGIKALIPFYAGSGLFMLIFGYLGFFDFAKYWRYLAFATLALFELHTITRPYHPLVTSIPTLLNPLSGLPLLLPIHARPPYLPFQVLVVAHKAIITLFIAINQLAPLFQSPTDAASNIEQQVARLEQLVGIYAVEAPRLLALEGAPLTGVDEDGNVVVGGRGLKEKVKEWFVTNAVRNDAVVRTAVQEVVERRRGGRGVLEET